MKYLLITASIIAAFSINASTAFSNELFPGYAGFKWGTDLHIIAKAHRKGNLGKIGEQVVYKQFKPNDVMNQRTFSFRDNGLIAVSVTFNPSYVRTVGMDHLLAYHKKMYGDGIINQSAAPQMIYHFWEDDHTRITLAFSPRRPDLTVLMFQQK